MSEREWQLDLPACFGNADKKFALHDADKQRAFLLLSKLRAQSVSLDQVEQAARDFLSGTGQEHIEEEVSQVRRHFAAWL